jgi:hypothetical protein
MGINTVVYKRGSGLEKRRVVVYVVTKLLEKPRKRNGERIYF